MKKLTKFLNESLTYDYYKNLHDKNVKYVIVSNNVCSEPDVWYIKTPDEFWDIYDYAKQDGFESDVEEVIEMTKALKVNEFCIYDWKIDYRDNFQDQLLILRIK